MLGTERGEHTVFLPASTGHDARDSPFLGRIALPHALMPSERHRVARAETCPWNLLKSALKGCSGLHRGITMAFKFHPVTAIVLGFMSVSVLAEPPVGRCAAPGPAADLAFCDLSGRPLFEGVPERRADGGD